jgi:hypothetical protein
MIVPKAGGNQILDTAESTAQGRKGFQGKKPQVSFPGIGGSSKFQISLGRSRPAVRRDTTDKRRKPVAATVG